MQISYAPLVTRTSRHFWVCSVCGYEWAMQQKGNWVGTADHLGDVGKVQLYGFGFR